MYYKTEVWHDDGGQTTPGWRRAETVWYQYDNTSEAAGNPVIIVRRIYNPQQPLAPPENFGYGLTYNTQGELWFIHQMRWTGHNCFDLPPGEPEKLSTHEFRSVGRAMRLTRQRDPEYFHVVLGWQDPIHSGGTWHDYDGDEIYSDLGIELTFTGVGYDVSTTETAAHEPGIGSFDHAANAASYRHGDQIGSTRAITGEGGMGVPPVTGRIVYTAFGERVWSDGAIGTRYQYAGAWGYQSELYDDASGNLPFVHVGHRWYDPSTGRFLQRDPKGIAGGLNVYEYGRRGPLNTVDPDGLSWIGGLWKMGKGIVSIYAGSKLAMVCPMCAPLSVLAITGGSYLFGQGLNELLGNERFPGIGETIIGPGVGEIIDKTLLPPPLTRGQGLNLLLRTHVSCWPEEDR